MKQRLRPFLIAVLIAIGAAAGSAVVRGSQSSAGIFTRVDPVLDALWSGFDMPQAQQHVEFITKFWRLAGNAGYDASLDRVQARLSAAGFTAVGAKPAVAGSAASARQFFDEYPNGESGGWDHRIGTLAIAGSDRASDEVVLSREKERLALCINSFSTPAGGVLAPLYDVGRGDRDEDYAGKNLKGAVVLGDADIGQLWRRAVQNGGAIGVISTTLPRYISPDPPGAKPTPRDEWDILQWSSIPYDATRKGFGFKASPRAAARLRRALASSPRPGGTGQSSDRRMVRVTVASTFSTKPNRTLVAEIPGRVAPEERVILAAHVQEPGANDNASGVATLAELAAALQDGIRAGKIPAPGRTLTFLFLNEIGGSRRWLQDHAEEAKRVRYMISMDMTGEDVAKTGGSFLVERWPDPGAVWDRPWDPHSEWGRGNVRAEQLKGDLINDVHLAVCERVARKTGWVVKSNPYEGGSDHTVFGSAGVPSLLDWHFTDRYYHTNFDTPDKTSAAEMRNVGVCAASTAWLFASADASLSISVAELVATAGKSRIAMEEREGAKLAAADKDPAAAKTREAQIATAWRKWYAEAVRSVTRLIVGPAPADFSQRLETLAGAFETPRSVSSPAAIRIIPASLQTGRGRTSTPTFVCGTDTQLPAPILVKWENVVIAADSQGFSPCLDGAHPQQHRESREAVVLHSALLHQTPEMRRLAVQAIGRTGLFEVPANFRNALVDALGSGARLDPAGPLAAPLNDSSPLVRREAANAIGEIMSGAVRELRPHPARPAADNLTWARTALERRLLVESDNGVAATILETIGRLKYTDDATRDEIEALLIKHADGAPERILGATKGLEALIRGNPKRQVGVPARETLRRVAVSGPTSSPVPTIGGPGTPPAAGDAETRARSRRLALLALQQARDDDVDTLVRAAADADWQVRRLVALRLDLSRPEFKPIVEPLLDDPAFQVRYEMIGPVARFATRTKDCSLPITYLDDPEPTVVLRAIDLLPEVCADDDDAIKQLVAWADDLKTPLGPQTWHVPAHALEALARLRRDAASPLLEVGVEHPIWQVRARAAAAAVALRNEDVATRLATDSVANVQTAALESLVSLKSPGVFQAAIKALESDDHQLIRTAAIALRATPEAERADAVNALLVTLRRLTDAGADTSRDPRVAILERLGEILPVERTADVAAFREDVDPKIREAAAAALTKLTGAQSLPASAVKRRYPYQPLPDDLLSLPSRAVLRMEGGGEIHLEMLIREAPVTIARFAELARAGYYNGLTFHRVVPNFVIQGGSPGANEYVGASRYMRDEVGIEPHTRGAVGISTRGHDTGDAQIFIDLVDVPRLDHEYTVFARVVAGLDVVDRVLEGARIQSVILR